MMAPWNWWKMREKILITSSSSLALRRLGSCRVIIFFLLISYFLLDELNNGGDLMIFQLYYFYLLFLSLPFSSSFLRFFLPFFTFLSLQYIFLTLVFSVSLLRTLFFSALHLFSPSYLLPSLPSLSPFSPSFPPFPNPPSLPSSGYDRGEGVLPISRSGVWDWPKHPPWVHWWHPN